ncbi:MAG: efflux RND transporter periplasmic adaptor subunit [Bryobacterales bacterium]|nr:efflux RND transporter periplasmic adaptor subunit [Bryobacterales bacterium]
MKCLLLLVVIALMSGCGQSPAPKAAEAKADAAKPEPAAPGGTQEVLLDAAMRKQGNIEVQEVTVRSLPEHVDANGRISVNENRAWHVGAITDGKVMSVSVNVGDRVKEGQVLAGLHSHDIHEARAEYRKANIELLRLKAAVSYAERQRDRAKRLFELKAGSQQQLEAAESELRNAKSALTAGEIEIQRTRLHLTEFLQVPADDDHDEHEGREVKHSADLIPVRSPADGVVLKRSVSAGSVASAGEELFHVADLSSVWMIANVQEEFLARLRVGMPAQVRVQAYEGRSFPGRIGRLGDELDPATRTVQVRVELQNRQGLLKPEMYATAEIGAGATRESIFIPEGAPQQVNGATAVFVAAAADRFAIRPVETGRTLDGMVEILSGLRAGDRIVTRGAYIVKSQMFKGEE